MLGDHSQWNYGLLLLEITIYLHFAALRFRKAEEVQLHNESTSFVVLLTIDRTVEDNVISINVHCHWKDNLGDIISVDKEQ